MRSRFSCQWQWRRSTFTYLCTNWSVRVYTKATKWFQVLGMLRMLLCAHKDRKQSKWPKVYLSRFRTILCSFESILQRNTRRCRVMGFWSWRFFVDQPYRVKKYHWQMQNRSRPKHAPCFVPSPCIVSITTVQVTQVPSWRAVLAVFKCDQLIKKVGIPTRLGIYCMHISTK